MNSELSSLLTKSSLLSPVDSRWTSNLGYPPQFCNFLIFWMNNKYFIGWYRVCHNKEQVHSSTRYHPISTACVPTPHSNPLTIHRVGYRYAPSRHTYILLTNLYNKLNHKLLVFGVYHFYFLWRNKYDLPQISSYIIHQCISLAPVPIINIPWKESVSQF